MTSSTDIINLIALAKEDFGKQRVNKAVDSLIRAVELLAGGQSAPVAETPPSEPAATPSETAEPTPADLSRVLATQDRESTEEPAKPSSRKRAPSGTRTDS